MPDSTAVNGGKVGARTISEIEKAFREMGLTEATWGRFENPPIAPESVPDAQIFIRIETTTTPIAKGHNADLA